MRPEQSCNNASRWLVALATPKSMIFATGPSSGVLTRMLDGLPRRVVAIDDDATRFHHGTRFTPMSIVHTRECYHHDRGLSVPEKTLGLLIRRI